MQKRREILMARDPHCHWCGRELKDKKTNGRGRLPKDFPTIDHLQNRFFGRKYVPNKEMTVLACPSCNNERQRKELSRWYITGGN